MPELDGDITAVDWDSDGEVADFVHRSVLLRETYAQDSEQQAEMNAAWYRGFQQTFWNRDARRLEVQANPNRRVRLTYNLIRGMVDGYVAKFALAPITLGVEPASPDVMDYERAAILNDVLTHYSRVLDLPNLVTSCDLLAVLHGETAVKVIWDPRAGTTIGRRANGRDIRQGDLRLVQLPIFNLFHGPPGLRFEQADWVLELHERSRAAVVSRYGLKPSDLDADRDENVEIIRPGEVGMHGSPRRPREPSLCVVKVLWVKRYPEIPGLEKGRHIVMVGRRVIRNGPNPYRHGEIPIVRQVLLDIPGVVCGDTFVSDLLVPQADLNRAISQFCENRELMANPVWLRNGATLIDEKEWTGRPGGIRTWTGGQRPELVPGAAMPAIVFHMILQTQRFMQEIIGLRDVSQGRNPPGVRSGRAAEILKEADEERMASVATRRTRFWRRIGWLMLRTLGQYVREQRIIRLRGEEQATRIRRFRGGDISDAINEYDVQVTTHSRPRSHSVTLAALDRALERGFLRPDNPHDRALVLGTLELGRAPQPIDPGRDARELQQERNLAMAHGEYTPPSPHEDLDTMLETMRRFQHKPFYQNLKPEYKRLFDLYETEAIIAMAQKSLKPRLIAMKFQQALAGRTGELPAATAPRQPTPGPPAGGDGQLQGLGTVGPTAGPPMMPPGAGRLPPAGF